MNKKMIIIILIISLVAIGIGTYLYIDYIDQKKEQEIAEKKKNDEKKLLKKINSHYNSYVITNKDAKIYELNDNKYIEVGKIGNNTELTLKKQEITVDTKYFFIDGLEYYISYEDINTINELTVKSDRHKSYIPFNQNIVTKNITNFYNKDSLVYSINKSFNLPILTKEKDKYYVEYLGMFLSVPKEDVESVVDNNNTTEVSSTKMAVLNYHFFYDPALGEECTSIICLTTNKFEEQLQYITTNNFLTVTMWEFERYIEGNLKLPVKSVLLTIDDGAMGVANKAIPLLEKYDQMATLFLITGWWPASNYKSDNLEIHSHSHNLHNQYECPGYGEQGGAIMCKDRAYLLNDLAESRKTLNNTTTFCYPFYDFNEYSISVLKEAGFTMAFRGGYIKATVGVDKFRVPRFSIMSYLTFEQFKALIN